MPPDRLLRKLSATLGLPSTVTLTGAYRDVTGVWFLATTPYDAVVLGTERQVRDPARLTDALGYVGRSVTVRLSHGAARRALRLLHEIAAEPASATSAVVGP